MAMQNIAPDSPKVNLNLKGLTDPATRDAMMALLRIIEELKQQVYKAVNNNATSPIAVSDGGTGITSYTTGDMLYANGATSLAKLGDVATGNVILSGGVGVAPAYGKVGLSTHVSGTLPIANQVANRTWEEL